MSASPQHLKPACGIASVSVVPAGAAAGGSPSEIAVSAEPVPLIEGRSSYDEISDMRDGILRVEHRLTIAVPAEYAHSRFDAESYRRWAAFGTCAVVAAVSGERYVVGWSERFGAGQPLRLTSVEDSTGTSPHAVPAVVLTLRSVDASPATRIF